MIIDFHTHAFPDQVAGKAVRQLENHYGIPPFGTGTLAHLHALLKEAGVTLGVISTAATKPEQVRSANDWALRLNAESPWQPGEGDEPGALLAFGTLHPAYPDIPDELARLKERGVRGLKFHADFQEFYLDSPEALEMFAAIGSDFVVLLHVGDRPERNRYATPVRLRRLLEALPDLRVVAAHFGGFQMWAEAREELLGQDVFFDTSSSLAFLSADEAVDLIRRHGPERILFGSDFPLWSPRTELARFCSLPLTDEERRLILWDNARRLLGL
ncbi:MAG: amidohydrolase family protein [Bacillota bacterium]|nr:amidohydrolase family protein [Bacillota bacterium]